MCFSFVLEVQLLIKAVPQSKMGVNPPNTAIYPDNMSMEAPLQTVHFIQQPALGSPAHTQNIQTVSPAGALLNRVVISTANAVPGSRSASLSSQSHQLVSTNTATVPQGG